MLSYVVVSLVAMLAGAGVLLGVSHIRLLIQRVNNIESALKQIGPALSNLVTEAKAKASAEMTSIKSKK